MDKEYRGKASLNLENVRSSIYQTRPDGILIKLYSWVAFLILGVLVGVAAFVIDVMV
jgi:hypothetical protein